MSYKVLKNVSKCVPVYGKVNETVVHYQPSVDVLTRLYQDVESDCKSEDDYLQTPS